MSSMAVITISHAPQSFVQLDPLLLKIVKYWYLAIEE